MNYVIKFLFIYSAWCSISLAQDPSSNNPYNVLGVDRGASHDQIHKAYKRAAMAYHPDRNQGVDTNEQMAKINSALEHLINGGPWNYEFTSERPSSGTA